MRHGLQWFIHLRAQCLSKGNEHPTNTHQGVQYSLPSPKVLLQIVNSSTPQSGVAVTRTWCDGVDERSDGRAVVPVCGKVVDRFVWNAALDPVEQALLGRAVVWQTGASELVSVPHRHRDGVVQDQRPHQTEDQLHLAVNDVRTVCNQTDRQPASQPASI